jgi:uncharacterized protein YggE
MSLCRSNKFAIATAVLLLTFGAAKAADRLVTVTGEGSIAVVPDMAMIRLGVGTEGKTAREASEANARTMSSVLAAIKDNGIEPRDIQTSQLSVQPHYEANKPGAPPHLTGFQVTNQVTVRIRDINALPVVLDRAIAAGANEMSGIEFVVSEQSKQLDKARGDAIADAHRKAELYATAAGGHLGHVVSISEEGAPPPVRPMAAMRAGAVPVAPGEQTLHAVVAVSYELEQ